MNNEGELTTVDAARKAGISRTDHPTEWHCACQLRNFLYGEAAFLLAHAEDRPFSWTGNRLPSYIAKGRVSNYGDPSLGNSCAGVNSMKGKTLAGRYCLTRKLGQGGMGSVWEAEHLTLRTKVAIKLVDPMFAESRDALARFQREAVSAAELRSAHIVHVMDYGIEDGVPFIAMELLEGESLAERLRREQRLSVDATKQLVTQICRALTVAHGKGIVHRDLKPDNIFITREGDDEVVKVLDFGVAKRLDALSNSGELKTSSGVILGTPYYMSPEQANGQGTVDQRSDIWSLGIMVYECLTGRRPFAKDTLGALIMSICQEPPPQPSQVALVPMGFDEWFARAACRDLALRFQTATEAAVAFNQIGRSSLGDSGMPVHGSFPASTASGQVPVAASTAPGESAPIHTHTTTVSPASILPSSVTAGTVVPKTSVRWLALLLVPTVCLLVAAGYWALSPATTRTQNSAHSNEDGLAPSAPAQLMPVATPSTLASPPASSSPTVLVVPTANPTPDAPPVQSAEPPTQTSPTVNADHSDVKRPPTTEQSNPRPGKGRRPTNYAGF